jgi:hypothetical protein
MTNTNSLVTFAEDMRKWEAAAKRKHITKGASLVCREVKARALDPMRAMCVTQSQAEADRLRRCLSLLAMSNITHL